MIFTLTLNSAVDRVLSSPGFAAGGLRRTELAALLAAGKGFNVSRILAELGTPSVAAGLVGAAEREFYSADFAKLGVETVLATFPSPTRSNITVLDPESGQETHLRERGPEVPAAAVDQLEERLLPRLGSGDTLVVCGSLPPAFPPERLKQFLLAARGRGARLFVDASGPALAAARTLRPEVLAINEEELGELGVRGSGSGVWGLGSGTQGPEDSIRGLASAAQALLEPSRPETRDPRPLLLIKRAAEGALAVTPSAAWRASPPKVEVRNTVGAGDAFNAGFLAREAEGVEQALAFAVACGAAQVESGMLGRLRRAEAERVLSDVRAEALKKIRGD